MKFDCIIMNPPYERNLHLKILAEAITHLKDDNSKVVNLSPVQWLIDPLNDKKQKSDYNTFQKNVAQKIETCDIISSDESSRLFNAGIMTNLGIYVCNNGGFDYQNVKWKFTNKPIFDKIINNATVKKITNIIEYSEKTKNIFVPIKLIANPDRTTAFNICTSTFKWIKNTKLPNGEDWKTGIYKSKSLKQNKKLVGVEFKTENEAKNFYASTYTLFFKFINRLIKGNNQNISPQFLPFMEDYTEPWTDERFYKFFNITPDEQKIIEETMEKYK